MGTKLPSVQKHYFPTADFQNDLKSILDRFIESTYLMFVPTSGSLYRLMTCFYRKLDLAHKNNYRHFYLERDLKLNCLNPLLKGTLVQLLFDIK